MKPGHAAAALDCAVRQGVAARGCARGAPATQPRRGPLRLRRHLEQAPRGADRAALVPGRQEVEHGRQRCPVREAREPRLVQRQPRFAQRELLEPLAPAAPVVARRAQRDVDEALGRQQEGEASAEHLARARPACADGRRQLALLGAQGRAAAREDPQLAPGLRRVRLALARRLVDEADQEGEDASKLGLRRRRQRRAADVAHAARVDDSTVIQALRERLPPALFAVKGELAHAADCVELLLLLLRVLILGPHPAAVLGDVLRGEDERAARVRTVAARASDLIVVVFERLRRTVVDDVLDRLGRVHAHPEGAHRRHKDEHLGLLKVGLRDLLVLLRHLRVEAVGRDLIVAQELAHILAELGRGDEDERELGLLLQRGDQPAERVRHRLARAGRLERVDVHADRELAAQGRRAEDGHVAHPEPLEDIAAGRLVAGHRGDEQFRDAAIL